MKAKIRFTALIVLPKKEQISASDKIYSFVARRDAAHARISRFDCPGNSSDVAKSTPSSNLLYFAIN